MVTIKNKCRHAVVCRRRRRDIVEWITRGKPNCKQKSLRSATTLRKACNKMKTTTRKKKRKKTARSEINVVYIFDWYESFSWNCFDLCTLSVYNVYVICLSLSGFFMWCDFSCYYYCFCSCQLAELPACADGTFYHIHIDVVSLVVTIQCARWCRQSWWRWSHSFYLCFACGTYSTRW